MLSARQRSGLKEQSTGATCGLKLRDLRQTTPGETVVSVLRSSTL